jgi:hypothetical protein
LSRTERISGYFLLRSSELREKILVIPLVEDVVADMEVAGYEIEESGDTKWICARSPSYLYSQVKRLFSKRSRTSEMDLVGLANIGFKGTPSTELVHTPKTD